MFRITLTCVRALFLHFRHFDYRNEKRSENVQYVCHFEKKKEKERENRYKTHTMSEDDIERRLVVLTVKHRNPISVAAII